MVRLIEIKKWLFDKFSGVSALSMLALHFLMLAIIGHKLVDAIALFIAAVLFSLCVATGVKEVKARVAAANKTSPFFHIGLVPAFFILFTFTVTTKGGNMPAYYILTMCLIYMNVSALISAIANLAIEYKMKGYPSE